MRSRNGAIEKHLSMDLSDRIVQVVKQPSLQLEFPKLEPARVQGSDRRARRSVLQSRLRFESTPRSLRRNQP